MAADTLYKWLNADGCTTFGREGWDLPKRNGKGWIAGAWIEAAGPLVMCENGIHLCRPGDLIHWIGERLYTAEAQGERLSDEAGDKIVVRRARLLEPIETINDVTLRLFAADCAESVLHLFEAKQPEDDRPRKAIEAARAYALGQINDAARDAARAAAKAAARNAAWDAAWTAAWTAARAAARAAGRAAAWAAVGAAAGAAAWTAARDAAWTAARAAAGDAAKVRLNRRLLLYIEHGQAAMHIPMERIGA